MTVNREEHMVELVDDAGRAVGSCSVAEAHTLPGRRHRAFSVLLHGPEGVLLQQRAEVKTRFPLRWSNTCCGHPAPGQAVTEAAAARLVEEMGLAGIELHEVGTFDYRAEDAATGRVEYEHDHVLIGHVESATPRPDTTEVADWRWMPLAELSAALQGGSDLYTPWLSGVIRLAEAALADR
jgi:isopentenyl-diphosphate Delta-isomerase